MYGIVGRQLYNLGSDHPDNSSTHLAPYSNGVNTALLTLFPMLILHPCD